MIHFHARIFSSLPVQILICVVVLIVFFIPFFQERFSFRLSLSRSTHEGVRVWKLSLAKSWPWLRLS